MRPDDQRPAQGVHRGLAGLARRAGCGGAWGGWVGQDRGGRTGRRNGPGKNGRDRGGGPEHWRRTSVSVRSGDSPRASGPAEQNCAVVDGVGRRRSVKRGWRSPGWHCAQCSASGCSGAPVDGRLVRSLSGASPWVSQRSGPESRVERPRGVLAVPRDAVSEPCWHSLGQQVRAACMAADEASWAAGREWP